MQDIIGAAEGRNPSPHFYTKYYLSQIDVEEDGNVNAIIHYTLKGKEEGIGTSPSALAIAPTLPTGVFRGSFDQTDLNRNPG